MMHLLKAKHWLIFTLSFALPFVFYVITMVNFVKSFSNIIDESGNAPDSVAISHIFTFIPLVMFLFIGMFFSWIWAVAIVLQQKVPAQIKMKVMKFKIFYFYFIIYILLFLSMFMGITQVFNFIEFVGPSLMGLILPLHLFAMFCGLYVMYFAAKTFKTIELQREVSFSDFAGEFFLIWFFPIGIWILQPKINKIIEEEE